MAHEKFYNKSYITSSYPIHNTKSTNKAPHGIFNDGDSEKNESHRWKTKRVENIHVKLRNDDKVWYAVERKNIVTYQQTQIVASKRSILVKPVHILLLLHHSNAMDLV